MTAGCASGTGYIILLLLLLLLLLLRLKSGELGREIKSSHDVKMFNTHFLSRKVVRCGERVLQHYYICNLIDSVVFCVYVVMFM